MAEHDSVIPAGGSGTLTAKVKTVGGQSRRFSKSISVVTDVTGRPPLILRFSVEAFSPIVSLPSFRINLTTIEGSLGRARILLHRADGENLAITKVVAEHPDLVVRTRPVTENGVPASDSDSEPDLWTELATRRRPINATPGDVWIELSTQQAPPPGNTAGSLHLNTNDPAAPEMSLPYMVRVRPMIETRPAAIRMWLSPVRGNEGRSAIVSLRHSEGEEFAITGVEASHPRIFSAAANSTDSASRQVVRINLIEGLGADSLAESIDGFIAVATDDPARSRIEIPVVVSPTRTLSRRRAATRPTPTR